MFPTGVRSHAVLLSPCCQENRPLHDVVLFGFDSHSHVSSSFSALKTLSNTGYLKIVCRAVLFLSIATVHCWADWKLMECILLAGCVFICVCVRVALCLPLSMSLFILGSYSGSKTLFVCLLACLFVCLSPALWRPAARSEIWRIWLPLSSIMKSSLSDVS